MAFGLERYDLSRLTRRIELPEISADPARPITLLLRAASMGNSAFRSELFRITAAERKAAAEPTAEPAPAPDPADAEAAAIAEDATIIAGTILVGWENVTDDGRPVAFSADRAREFVIAMRTHVPDIWNARVAAVMYEAPEKWRPIADPVDLGKG